MTRDELTSYVTSHFGNKLTLLDTGRFAPVFEIRPEDLLEVARGLRDDDNLQMDYLCNMGGVDTGEKLEVIYNLASTKKNLRIDFKFSLGYENPEVDSVQEIWPGVNWYEREMWELYGINVRNHGDLRQLLLPDHWDQGPPMRKDWDAPDFIRMPEL
jgi:NADH-quinone oxidoreductase subunit C